MANRHLARSIVVQSLFALDFTDTPSDPMETLEYYAFEFSSSHANPFMKTLLETTLKKRSIIDDIIEKAAPEWPIDKINPVDRNVLRLGLCELLFGNYNETPPKVAINEAIELAKSFGGDSSGRFVNGVMGAVYREIGEPGKDQKSKKKNVTEDISTLPVEEKAGGVVYSRDEEGNIHLLFVHDIFGFWTLSKGSTEEGETPGQACIREIKEETNIDVSILGPLGENEYVANHPENGRIRKHVTYFLAKALVFEEPKLEVVEDGGGLDDVRWFPISEVPGLRMYDDVTKLITKAITLLLDGDVDSDTVS